MRVNGNSSPTEISSPKNPRPNSNSTTSNPTLRKKRTLPLNTPIASRVSTRNSATSENSRSPAPENTTKAATVSFRRKTGSSSIRGTAGRIESVSTIQYDKAQKMNLEASSNESAGSVDRQVAGRELRELKAKAQRLKPLVKLGKEGLSESFLRGLDQALSDHELVKVKFEEFKDQKKELAPALAARARAQIIMRVGNVVVLFRRRAQAGPAA